MIDINELRRLAQAATSGEWYVERGNHIYGRNEVTDGEEVWHPVIACTDDDEVNVNFEANAAFIAAADPAAVSEIIDLLEAAERERDECNRRRLEAADHFAAQTALMKKKYDALRAKVEAMEKQEPVGQFIQHPSNGLWEQDGYGDNPDARPLYALPGVKGEEK